MYNLKLIVMKAKVLFCGLLITLILFIDYIFLTLIGCTAGACNASDGFFCTVFCKLVVFLVVATSLLPFLVALYKSYIQKKS